MRIGINARFLLKGRLEGIGVYTQEISSRLVKLFPQHQWFFFFDRPYDASFITDSHVKGVVVSPQARHPFLWYWWFEQSIPNQLKEHQIDLFFSPDGYCSLSTDVPQLLTIHDIAFEHHPEAISWLVNQYYRHYTPLFCRKAAHIICVSEHTQQDLFQQYKIDEAKTTVVHNGFSDNFKPIDTKQQEEVRLLYSNGLPYFIYVGAVHPRKNVTGILKAFEHLKETNPELPHQLVIVGRNAWDNDSLMKFLTQMNAKSSVHWYQDIAREKISSVIGASVAMVYPSFYEGFGLPVLEAMACGVPSITSKDSPMSSFAKDSCLTVSPDDYLAIAEYMKRMIDETESRSVLCNRALNYSANMSWDHAAEKIAVMMEKILLNKKKN